MDDEKESLTQLLTAPHLKSTQMRQNCVCAPLARISSVELDARMHALET